jgi:hypothetical protein
VVSFTPSQNYSAIKVLFNPDKLNASSFGIAPAPLRIEVPGNAQVGQYVIPILVNMSAGSILTSKVIQLANAKTTKANLTISVVEPPSVNQRIKDFWSTYDSLVLLVGAGFAGGASTVVFEYLKNRKKEKQT